MCTKNFTFDPDAGVPSAADLALYGGANFKNHFNVTTTSNTKYDLTGWTGSAQMRKSTSVGSTTVADATFTVGFTSAYDGKFSLTLASAATTSISEGRYMYNVLVSSGTTIYNIVNGDILVYQGISSAPS